LWTTSLRCGARLDWLAHERDRFALGIRTEVHR
jgi:hypothetical protein